MANAHHGLSNIKTDGYYSRHTARFPNILEPPGLLQDDHGERPVRPPLITWSRGKSVLWDSTVRNTLAASSLYHS